MRSISDLPGPRRLAVTALDTALGTIARDFEIELDPAAAPVTELLGFTMSPKGLRVRLRERTPGDRRLRLGSGS